MGVLFLALAALCYHQGETFLTLFLGATGALFLAFGLMRLGSKGYSRPNREVASTQAKG
jgi:hypothetical protein